MSKLDESLIELDKQLAPLYADIEKDIEAATCPHCQGVGRFLTKEIKAKKAVIHELMEKKRAVEQKLFALKCATRSDQLLKTTDKEAEALRLKWAVEDGLCTEEEKNFVIMPDAEKIALCGSVKLWDAK